MSKSLKEKMELHEKRVKIKEECDKKYYKMFKEKSELRGILLLLGEKVILSDDAALFDFLEPY